MPYINPYGNGDPFIIVFGLFGWYLYSMLRYTAVTVGDESSLQVPVTYCVTPIQYFTRFDFIFLVSMSLMSLWMSGILLRYAPTAKTTQEWLLVFVCVSLFPLLFYGLFIAFRLEAQYARITIDVEVTLDPIDKSVQVWGKDQTTWFTANELAEIEHHVPVNYKLPYRYFLFRLQDGRQVYLNDSNSYLYFSLEGYFKQVPVHIIRHEIPWIEPQ